MWYCKYPGCNRSTKNGDYIKAAACTEHHPIIKEWNHNQRRRNKKDSLNKRNSLPTQGIGDQLLTGPKMPRLWKWFNTVLLPAQHIRTTVICKSDRQYVNKCMQSIGVGMVGNEYDISTEQYGSIILYFDSLPYTQLFTSIDDPKIIAEGAPNQYHNQDSKSIKNFLNNCINLDDRLMNLITNNDFQHGNYACREIKYSVIKSDADLSTVTLIRHILIKVRIHFHLLL